MNKKAFTLIETAIVLVIIGLLLGLGLKSCVSGIETAKIDGTKDKLKSLKQEVINYERKYRKLPKDLSEVDKNIKDAWGNEITYIHSNATDVCSSNETNVLTLKLPNNSTADDVAFVLISNGKNQRLDSDNLTIRNDDIYEITSIYEVKNDCCRYGKIFIKTDALSPIKINSKYSTTISVMGGHPPYSCNFTNISCKENLAGLLNNHTSNGTSTNPFCKINMDSNETSSLNETSCLLRLNVKDNKDLKASRNVSITITR